MAETRTFGNLINEWMATNGLSRKVGAERFGTSFDNWVNDRNAPRDDRIPEVSDKTGYPIDTIQACISNTREKIRKASEEKQRLMRAKNKPVEHTQAELEEEANAVRKLTNALTREDIAKSYSLSDEKIKRDIDDARNGESFDTLIDIYAEKKSERNRLAEQLKQLSKAIEDIDTELVTIKNKIRRVA